MEYVSEDLRFVENLTDLPSDLRNEPSIQDQLPQFQQQLPLLNNNNNNNNNRIPSTSSLPILNQQQQQQLLLTRPIIPAHQLPHPLAHLQQQQQQQLASLNNNNNNNNLQNIQNQIPLGQPLAPLIQQQQPVQSPSHIGSASGTSPKRTRGRPRKPSGQGRSKPRGRGRPKGKGGKLVGMNSKRRRGDSTDSELGQEEEDGEGETDSEQEIVKELDGESENEDAEGELVVKKRDMGQEMPDDFNPAEDPARKGPTTKFGRKISKPTIFAPAVRIPPRKKRIINPESLLMCQICTEGHSPAANRLVICEACEQGFHQLCHDPNIQEEHIDTDLSWLCKDCDTKAALARPPIDVMQGDWVAGLKVGSIYTVEEKKEWMESLPLHSLIGYILSIEKKFTPTGQSGSALWPPALPKVLADNRARKLVAEEERKVREIAAEAEALRLLEIEEREMKLARDAEVRAKEAAKATERAEATKARTVASRQQEKPSSSGSGSSQPQPRQLLSQGSNSRPQSPHSPPGVSPFLRHSGFVPVPALQQHQQQQQQHQHQQQPQYQNHPPQYGNSSYSQIQPQGGAAPYPVSHSRPGSGGSNSYDYNRPNPQLQHQQQQHQQQQQQQNQHQQYYQVQLQEQQRIAQAQHAQQQQQQQFAQQQQQVAPNPYAIPVTNPILDSNELDAMNSLWNYQNR